MPRSVNHVASRAKRKKILGLTRGYFGARKNVWCSPMDNSPPGSSVHVILQARILERVACQPMSPALQVDSLLLSHQGSSILSTIPIKMSADILKVGRK